MTGVFCLVVLAGVLLGAFNIVVDEYVRGALRNAVEQGAQEGAGAGGSTAECQAVAGRALDALVRGPFAGRVTISCTDTAGGLRARALGRLPSLVPPVPQMRVDISAYAPLPGAGK